VRTAITLNDFVFDSSPGFDEVADHVVAAEALAPQHTVDVPLGETRQQLDGTRTKP
jgi:hypothetical protein